MTLLAGSRPDAALLDLHLLDGRATEVAEALEAKGVPFALMTGCGQKGNRRDALFRNTHLGETFR